MPVVADNRQARGIAADLVVFVQIGQCAVFDAQFDDLVIRLRPGAATVDDG